MPAPWGRSCRTSAHTDWLPELHSGAETIAFCGTMIDRGWVTVAQKGGVVVGFVTRDGHEGHALFVAGREQGRGIGKLLLDAAKDQSPVLELWTFAANTGAQAFYEREGFVEAGRSEGAGNDENLPDITYRWCKEACP